MSGKTDGFEIAGLSVKFRESGIHGLQLIADCAEAGGLGIRQQPEPHHNRSDDDPRDQAIFQGGYRAPVGFDLKPDRKIKYHRTFCPSRELSDMSTVKVADGSRWRRGSLTAKRCRGSNGDGGVIITPARSERIGNNRVFFIG